MLQLVRVTLTGLEHNAAVGLAVREAAHALELGLDGDWVVQLLAVVPKAQSQHGLETLSHTRGLWVFVVFDLLLLLPLCQRFFDRLLVGRGRIAAAYVLAFAL